MYRLRSATFVLFAFTLCSLAVLVAGCAGGEEQAFIRSYFRAAQYNDTATLGNIAMVAFDPQEDGIVTSLGVDNVTEEVRRTLRVRELSQAIEQAEAAEEEFTARKIAYQDENVDAINRVLEAERENREVGRRDQEVQEAWTKWRQETMEHAKKVSDALSELSSESAVAELSVFDPNNPIDLTAFDGELITKDVTITASVRTPDNEQVERTMVVTLQRAELTGADGQPLNGRWIITSLSPVG